MDLWLFTTRYPYGMREAFLENEIAVLCKRFDRVLIFPEHPEGPLRPIPANAEVHLPVKDPFASASWMEMLRMFWQVTKLLRSLLRDAPSTRVLRSQWPSLRSRIAQFVHRSKVLIKEVMPLYDPERVVVYAYWTHDWTTVLGLVQEKFPELRFISRAHGFDVFEAQNTNGWIPFRAFQLDHVSRIYCASRTGLEHLRSKHPGRASLFELARLGTRDHGPGPIDASGPLRVVSCSFLIPRKRVLLLIEALALVERSVHWTHFGGGEEDEAVRTAASRLPHHVQVDLRGMTPNSEVIEWYRSHPVDVFVHLSHLEGGVAVAVQEATSFGIPVIAADSGGVRDLVGHRTGRLLEKDPTAAAVAALLEGFREGPMGTPQFRNGVREVWRAEFEANEVFDRFVDVLTSSAISESRYRS